MSEEHGTDSELVERELLVSYLKSKLARYSNEGRNLFNKNKDLSEEISLLKVNMQDIVDFMTAEAKKKDQNVNDLERKCAELLEEIDKLKHEKKAEMDMVTESKDREITELREVIQQHEDSLEALSEFREKKAELDDKLADANKEIEHLKKEYEDNLSDLERKHVKELDRLKKENAVRIKETKQAMLKLTNNQLATTTKRTILENEQMASELSYQSRQTEKLLQRNQELIDDNAALQREMNLSRQTEEELAKRSTVYQKTVKSLITKQRGLENSRHDLEVEVTELRESLLEAHTKLKEAEESEQNAIAERDSLRQSAAFSERDKKRKAEMIDETVNFLLKCMDDVKATIDRELSSTSDIRAGEDEGVQGFNYSSLKQREIAIQYLLERLGEFTRMSVATKGLATVGSNLPPIPTVRSIDAIYSNQHSTSNQEEQENVNVKTLSLDFQESSTFSLPDRLAHQVLNTTATANRRLGGSRGEMDVKNMMPSVRGPTLRSIGMQTTKSDPLLLGLPKSLAYEDILSRDWGQISRSLPLSQSLSRVTQQRRKIRNAALV